MKTVLWVVGIVVLVGVVGLVGLVILGSAVSNYRQEEFFRAVDTGDGAKVMAKFHPVLRKEVDEPLITAWAKAINEHCGKFKGLDDDTWTKSKRDDNGVTVTVTKGKVKFEKATVEADLDFAQGKIVKFFVGTKPLPADWFKGPASTDLYRRQAEKLIRLLLANKPAEAFALMHPSLQEAMPLPKLTQVTERIAKNAGVVKVVQFKANQALQGDVFKLKILFDVECEKVKTVATVVFVFKDMKGHILAFDLTGEGV